MRIGLVTRRYPPDCCGVGDYTARLAETLGRQGHEVIVYVAERKEDGSSRLQVGSLNGPGAAAAGGRIRVVELKLNKWGDVAGAVRKIREAEPERVQIEYSNYGWSRVGCAFWLNRFVGALRQQGVRVTVALHEFPLYFRQAPLQAGISLAQRAHFGLLAMSASEVLTNTRERVRLLRRWVPWKQRAIHYRPNSATIPVAPVSAEKRAALRAEHGAGRGEIVVSTFGAFHSGKRYEAAIEAVAKLRRELPLTLWVLGDERGAQAKYVAQLRERARPLEEQAWWPGHMPAEEISACLQATDIFVLPQPDGHLTRSSAFMAAAAHGLAVIAVRNDENQAEFTHGENVWLVEKNGAGQFAEAIRRLASDPSLRERLGRNLRAVYEKEFAWEKTAVRSGE
jgi:glycosyltransferase involved in cell wall biosynthesis